MFHLFHIWDYTYMHEFGMFRHCVLCGKLQQEIVTTSSVVAGLSPWVKVHEDDNVRTWLPMWRVKKRDQT